MFLIFCYYHFKVSSKDSDTMMRQLMFTKDGEPTFILAC